MVYYEMGGPSFAAKYIFLVALGRVFYHCHYFGDTVVGASIGITVGTVLNLAGSNKLAGVVADLICQLF
jgi:hypothetical protein